MNERVRPAALVAALAVLSVGAAADTLPFSDGKWELPAKGAVVETVEGRETLALENGLVPRRDVGLQDGTIEFDVQVTRRRSFVYAAFRMGVPGEHEEFYLRPHKSGLPDSVQYAPVYQGESAWQLYHGPGGTAAVEFAPGVWTHVRIVLQGRRSALFIGDLAKPVLVVPRLGHEPRAGGIALGAYTPPGTSGAGPVARFANVSVRPGAGVIDAPDPEASAPGAGIVRVWEVGRAFPPSRETVAAIPAAGLSGEFRRLEALPGGLLELHRLVRMPEGSQEAGAVARLRVRAAAAAVRAFDLGFSDRVTVFLDGRPVFSGNAAYSFDRPRRDGVIGYDQARVWLPLAAGANELTVVVSDGFGGWGLMGRFPDPEGLEWEPR